MSSSSRGRPSRAAAAPSATLRWPDSDGTARADAGRADPDAGRATGRPSDEKGPRRQELDSFVRAFSGAFLFGMPLLFTMEMWWLGPLVPPWKLLALLGVALLANLGLAYFAGFKQERGFLSHLEQAVDALPVEIANSGDKIVEDLRVRLVLGSSQDQQEVTEVEVRFLAGGETNRAVAVFRSDPAAAPLTANAASYLEP